MILLAASGRCISWGKRQRDVELPMFFEYLKSKYLVRVYPRTEMHRHIAADTDARG